MINLQNSPVGDNMPGIREVYFTESENLFSLSTDNDYIIGNDILFKANAVWYRIGFGHESARLSENEVKSGRGSYFDISLSGTIPKVTREKMYSIFSLRNRNFMLAVVDQNGLIKIIGDEENYLRLNKTIVSGASGSDANQVNFQFTGKILKKARFYSGSIIVDPPTQQGIGFDVLGANNIIG